MKIIQLSKGYVAKVDDEDFEYLSQFSWHTKLDEDGKPYAASTSGSKWGKKKKHSKMHRVIKGVTDPTILVDHADGDSLNNQRYNLREATYTQNLHNARLRIDNKSGFKGVSKCCDRDRWQCVIKINGKRVCHRFKRKEDAAAKYRELATIHFGEFARFE